MRKPALVFLGTSIALASLYACVGDSPTLGTDTTDSGSQDGTTSQADAFGPGTDGSMGQADTGSQQDAALTCDAGLTPCGSTCVDLLSSPTNCNACNRSCGGAMCSAGICLSNDFATLPGLNDFALDGAYVYFSQGNFIQRCPKAGPCAGVGITKLADFTGVNPDGTGLIAAANGRVVFVGNTSGNSRMYECAGTGCPAPPLISIGASMVGYDHLTLASQAPDGGTTNQLYAYMAMQGVEGWTCTNGTCSSLSVLYGKASASALLGGDGTHYFYQSPSGFVGRCPASEVPCATPLNVANVNNARQLVTNGGEFVLLFTNSMGRDEIAHCLNGGCSMGIPTSIKATFQTVAVIAADGPDVYWFDNSAGPDGGVGYTLHTCPIANCATTKELTAVSGMPSKLLLDSQFAYWSDATGVIHRIAR